MKKHIKLITLLIIFIVPSSHLMGQQSNSENEEAFLQQIESSASTLPLQNNLNLNNKAQILQMGNNNSASVNQTLAGTSVMGNIAELIQNGNVNNAVITQTGNGNSHFINQTGNSNMFEASVIGDNNVSTIDQIGNDNLINQNLLGNDMSFILSQQGNGNQLVQIENNTPVKQYQVFQQGSGMKLIIINGGIIP